jgi:hypothetical protein
MKYFPEDKVLYNGQIVSIDTCLTGNMYEIRYENHEVDLIHKDKITELVEKYPTEPRYGLHQEVDFGGHTYQVLSIDICGREYRYQMQKVTDEIRFLLENEI